MKDDDDLALALSVAALLVSAVALLISIFTSLAEMVL